MASPAAVPSAAPRLTMGAPDPMEQPLPPLRDDLRLLPGPTARDGSPTWTIHDPVRNRYHRLGWAAFEMLARWPAGTGAAVCARVAAETTLAPGKAELEQLLRFLRANALVDMGSAADRGQWTRQAEAMRQRWSSWLLHNYLFFRIPLVRPDGFLRRTWPLVRPLFSPAAGWIMALLALVAVYLVARRWDAFVHTFTQFASLQGLAWMGVALVVTKILHELGHAYTAHRYGCRVPTMGVAFMVLWPVLYTDTSDGWTLTERRKRLAIGAAGVTVELCVAVLATFVWALTDDGPLRSAAFFLATAGWTASLAINLNPFMRFDGYYLLADWLDEPNLQPRAFALGRWRLRELLFGLGDPPPEALPRGRRRLLVVYAWATWLYRLVLFLGIALLVYHFFIKVVGILLFAVEIGWFILRPVASEVKVWWQRRGDLRPTPNVFATLGLLALLAAVLVVPWRTAVPLPAVYEAARSHEVHAPEPAQVAQVLVAPGQAVRAGEPLVVLTQPHVDFQLALARLRVAVTQMTLDRAVTDEDRRADVPLLTADLQTQMAEEAGLVARQGRMTLTAAVDGVAADLLPGLRPGLWVEPTTVLLRVVGREDGRIVAYAGQDDLPHLQAGAAARFHPDDALAPALDGAVAAVETVNRPVLDHAMLSADQGGPIAARPDAERRLTPERSVYRVTITPAEGATAPDQVRRGTVRVEGRPESLAVRLWRAVAGVLIRESGF
ncbi:site-2 protease family protein [Caenispirillum bisanense]|uniref:Putative peptide zinc metalloprotease protein n=1 Tax=Caenispirillum bisanense TaxID=414052 RepID=A0A286G6M2_9PROT|nr:site-2 protease family protein [Caenispirillum bisanense]SOD90769.1 putative peptide zinc metalloprotease protein [Caenispirillum bisanense]